MRTFDYFYTGTAVIRQPFLIGSGGKRGTAGGGDTTILCTDMTVVSDDEVRRQVKAQGLNTPFEARQVYAGSTGTITVRKSDSFILGGRIFPIRSVEKWPLIGTGEHLLRLIIEVIDK